MIPKNHFNDILKCGQFVEEDEQFPYLIVHLRNATESKEQLQLWELVAGRETCPLIFLNF